jgi:uncharacterized membrane protein
VQTVAFLIHDRVWARIEARKPPTAPSRAA